MFQLVRNHKIFSLTTIASAAAIAALLFGDNLIPRFTKYVAKLDTQEADYTKSDITVVVYRRGRGGYLTLGNAVLKAQALGFKALSWHTENFTDMLQNGWGVEPDFYNRDIGAIYYPPNLVSFAEELQNAFVQGNYTLRETIPLVEADIPDDPVFIGPTTISKYSILVYAPN